MKIEKIRFRNLNSLVGTWEIDLTDPAYSSEGLFAIVGSTGAGKTTILDAVCLALYGCTPRLGGVSSGSNEIMSRHTGECSSDVTFETQKGRFRCSWQQRRARGKSDGNLQSQKHEIVDDRTNQILADSMKGVRSLVEEKSGLDFKRFTRSVLLAQGNFDAFLKANSGERAPILEQITGTEIYSKISEAVFKRQKDEHTELTAIKLRIGDFNVLSDEEESNLVEKHRQEQKEAEMQNKTLLQLDKQIQHLQLIDALTTEVQDLKEKKAELIARKEDFEPFRLQLDAAERALELDADYRQLVGMRSQQEKDQQDLKTSKISLDESTVRVEECEIAFKAAREQHERARSEQRRLMPLLQEVRGLDIHIQNSRNRLSDLAKDCQSLMEKRDEHQETKSELTDKLAHSIEALEEINNSLGRRKSDEKLVDKLSLLESDSRILLLAITERDRIADDLAEASEEQESLLVIRDEGYKRARLATHNLDQQQAKLKQKHEEIEEVLEGQELSHWQCRKRQLEDTLNTLELKKNIARDLKDLESLNERSAVLSEEKLAFEEKSNELRKSKVQLNSAEEHLMSELISVRKIENLEDERIHLVDGEPCPLCGSMDHPYVTQVTPVSDETALKLGSVREDLDEITNELNDSSHQVTRLKTELETVNRQRDKLKVSMNTTKEKLDNTAAFPESNSSTKDSLDEIEVEIQEIKTGMNSVEAVITESQSAQGVMNELHEDLQKCLEQMNKAQQACQRAEGRHEQAMAKIQGLEGQLDGKHTQATELLEGLQSQFKVYGFDSVSETDVERTVAQLSSRRNQWMSDVNRKNDLEGDIHSLGLQLESTREVLQDSECRLAAHAENTGTVSEQLDKLVRERKEKFGEKKPDDVDATLRHAIEVADDSLQDGRQKLADANLTLERVTTRSNKLSETIHGRMEPLKQIESSFCERLAKSGFADEEEYFNACLPEDMRAQLKLEQDIVTSEFTTAETELNAKSKELKEKLEEERSAEPLSELQNRKEELSGKIEKLQQAIGGLKQRLDDNESEKEKLQDWNLRAKRQQRECRKWDLLYAFIGSKDGKKFREFAQGITFESLIGRANVELKKLSDRYLLVRGEENPLDLQVIDNYQAGAVRPTSNLSGGESFIVSLALALGLSHMASQNVQLDSLFLDEGFGTLDEDTLSEALAVLGSLQQEGKLIGVISHVPALKERIFTQIQVVSGSSGRSLLSGPGCSRITNGN